MFFIYIKKHMGNSKSMQNYKSTVQRNDDLDRVTYYELIFKYWGGIAVKQVKCMTLKSMHTVVSDIIKI